MKAELQRRQSNTDRVEALFRGNQGVWINARDFEIPGGRQGWRTRISECRRDRDMFIENREDRNSLCQVVASWYRYLPAGKPLGPDAATPRSEKHPARQTDLPL